jgi:hypothetical protein
MPPKGKSPRGESTTKAGHDENGRLLPGHTRHQGTRHVHDENGKRVDEKAGSPAEPDA